MENFKMNDDQLEFEVLCFLYENPEGFIKYNLFPDLFFNNLLKTLFVIFKRFSKDDKMDYCAIDESIKKKGIEDLAGMLEKIEMSYIPECIFVKRLESLFYYWKTRKIYDLFIQNLEKLKEKENIKKIAFEITEKLTEISDFGFQKEDNESFKMVIKEYLDTIKEIIEKEEEKQFIKTGFLILDKYIRFEKGDLIIIAGRPSMGKTMFTINLIKNNCECSLNVGFMSLEMTKTNIMDRVIKLLGGKSRREIIFQKKQHNYKKFNEYQEINKSIYDNLSWNLFIEDSGGIKLSDLIFKMRKWRKYNNIDIVYIDYLSYILPDRREQTRNAEIETITRTLKALAKELNIPIVLLSQLNRCVEHRTDKRPILSDLRESGAIEQDADKVLMLFRPLYYLDKEKDFENYERLKNILYCYIRKNRQGKTGEVKLYIDLKNQFISNLEEEGADIVE